MIVYHDDQRIDWAGRRPRIICAATLGEKAGAMSTMSASWEPRVTSGADAHGDFMRFAPQTGDRSAEERKKYGDGPCPMRAMLAFDGGEKATPSAGRRGATLVQRFGLLIEPGAQIKPDLHATIAQWNVWPAAGPPPLEFGIVNLPRLKDGRAVKVGDVPQRDEYLEMIVRALDPATGKGRVVSRILTQAPIRRGTYWREVELRFRDGQGGDGYAELLVNGASKGAWRGATGYPGSGVPYPGAGAYLHAGQTPVAVLIYRYDERIEPA